MKVRELILATLMTLALLSPTAQAAGEHPLLRESTIVDTTPPADTSTPGEEATDESTDKTATPSNTTEAPAMPTPGQPGIIIIDPSMIEEMFGKEMEPKTPKAPTPEMLESVYHKVWKQVAQKYHDPSRLHDWDTWATKYDGKLTTSEELERALKEMLGSLNDKWTRYVPTFEIKEAREKHEAGVIDSGVGIKKLDDGSIIVDYRSYGSVAYSSKLRRLDVIKTINGTAIDGKSVEEIEEMLSGKQGDRRTIEFSRDGKDDKVTLTLAPSAPNQGEAKLLPEKIGYIRFPGFDDKNFQGFLNAIGSVHEAAGGNLRGLVLDLRGNSGGAVHVALDIMSMFIEKGVVFTSTTREGRMVKHETMETIAAQPHDFVGAPEEMATLIKDLYKVPLVILVNDTSASSSEIVTGAMKDNGRATIIGTTTYGKGVAYIQGKLPPGGVMSITTLDYVTPSGYNLAGRGIVPNIVIDDNPVTPADEQLIKAVEVVTKASSDPLPKQSDEDSTKMSGSEGWASNPLIIAATLAGFLLIIVLTYRHHQLQSQRRRKEKEENKPEEKERY